MLGSCDKVCLLIRYARFIYMVTLDWFYDLYLISLSQLWNTVGRSNLVCSSDTQVQKCDNEGKDFII